MLRTSIQLISFAMAANQTNMHAMIGKRHTENSYNILSTFWELPRAPESWRSDSNILMSFGRQITSLRNHSGQFLPERILTMPPCINLAADTSSNRAKFGFDASRFYFLFILISIQVQNERILWP